MNQLNLSNITAQAPSISSSAMLVELNISVWTGRKFDKGVSAEVAITKQADNNSGNYNKKLFPNNPTFDAITKYAGNARTYHYHATMPWSDSGVRLLTTAMYFDYAKEISRMQMEFDALVEDFLKDYYNLVQSSQVKLGTMFDATDYPDVEDVRAKYRFNVRYSPVPEVGDWRVDVGNDALKELAQSYELAYQQNLETAYKDVWTRTHEALSRMSDKLAGNNKQIFRDTLVSNVTEMVDLLDKFNVTGDAEMRKAKDLISDALMGITPDALREDTYLRQETKSKVDALLKEFSW